MPCTRVIILGCGFGGLATAQALARQQRDDLHITAFNRTPVLYNYPVLPRLLLGDLPEEELNWPLAELMNPRRVDFQLQRIARVDLTARQVSTDTQTIDFDYLVIAPGGKAKPLTQDDGFQVFYPKAARHLVRLREEVRNLIQNHTAGQVTIAVVGGGLTGIEFAVSLRRLIQQLTEGVANTPRIDIKLLEQAPRLAPHCHPSLGIVLQRQLMQRGITVLLAQRVERVASDHVQTSNGALPAQLTVCCIGSQSDLRFELIGLNHANQTLPIEPSLQLQGHPRCFVVGDAAELSTAKNTETKRASHAIHQGRSVANNLLRLIDNKPAIPYRVPWHPTLVTLGDHHATLEFGGFCVTGRWPARLKRFLETRYL